MLTQAIAITNDKDIMAIHSVVSNQLKEEIEQAYPHLFRKQFDFTKLDKLFQGKVNLPFTLDLPFVVGKGLVSDEDKYKSLIVHPEYDLEVVENVLGNTILRFFKK